mmetsp:Transcript_35042/g.52286  ORF Transcript_35042/g.52286 Transcript_35042/m.52286 type:complete len:80 (+) Transcript_35042:647-886(+)
MNFDYQGLRVNILDTPGHQDFSEDTYRALAAGKKRENTHSKKSEFTCIFDMLFLVLTSYSKNRLYNSIIFLNLITNYAL